jgi:hypothetical protein
MSETKFHTHTEPTLIKLITFYILSSSFRAMGTSRKSIIIVELYLHFHICPHGVNFTLKQNSIRASDEIHRGTSKILNPGLLHGFVRK